MTSSCLPYPLAFIIYGFCLGTLRPLSDTSDLRRGSLYIYYRTSGPSSFTPPSFLQGCRSSLLPRPRPLFPRRKQRCPHARGNVTSWRIRIIQSRFANIFFSFASHISIENLQKFIFPFSEASLQQGGLWRGGSSSSRPDSGQNQ